MCTPLLNCTGAYSTPLEKGRQSKHLETYGNFVGSCQKNSGNFAQILQKIRGLQGLLLRWNCQVSWLKTKTSIIEQRSVFKHTKYPLLPPPITITFTHILD